MQDMPVLELQAAATERIPRLQVPARLQELDMLRGFLLLWMTLTHLPTRVSAYSNQAIGYVSAAEGFVFLAALLTGQVHRSAVEKYGSEAAFRKLFRRAWRIYRYHVALVAITFTIGAAVAIHLGRLPLANLMDFYLLHPKLAAVSALALLYDPPLLDILPMYLIFTLLTPLLLWAAKRFGWTSVLAGSGIVWLLAQCNLRLRLYAVLNAHGFPVPAHEAGAFDLFAWQLLWTFGLALGTTVSRERISRQRVPGPVLAVSAAIAAAFLFCRHAPLDLGPLVDKWRLGVLRLIDFAAIGILLLKWGPVLARTRWAAVFAPLGRSSLEVFSVHVLCCLAALGLSVAAEPSFPVWEQILLLTVTTASLFWTGYRADARSGGTGSLAANGTTLPPRRRSSEPRSPALCRRAQSASPPLPIASARSPRAQQESF
jgi:hypothetical protein